MKTTEFVPANRVALRVDSDSSSPGPGKPRSACKVFVAATMAAVFLMSSLGQAEPIQRNRIKTFDGPGGFQAPPEDINNAFSIVGRTFVIDGEGATTGAAFVYRGRFRELVEDDDKVYEYMGINDKGDIVGIVTPAGQPNVRTGFLKKANVITDVKPFSYSGYSYFPADINNRGDIVGTYNSGGVFTRGAFVQYANGTPWDLLYGYEESDEIEYLIPSSINDEGTIVGKYKDYNVGVQAFVYRDEHMRAVYSPESDNMGFTGINNWDIIVGNDYIDETTSKAFVYFNKQFFPVEIGAVSTEVTAINDWGAIAGTYRDDPHDIPHAFVAHIFQFVSLRQILDGAK